VKAWRDRAAGSDSMLAHNRARHPKADRHRPEGPQPRPRRPPGARASGFVKRLRASLRASRSSREGRALEIGGIEDRYRWLAWPALQGDVHRHRLPPRGCARLGARCEPPCCPCAGRIPSLWPRQKPHQERRADPGCAGPKREQDRIGAALAIPRFKLTFGWPPPVAIPGRRRRVRRLSP